MLLNNLASIIKHFVITIRIAENAVQGIPAKAPKRA
jgi:hypothetical protein